MLNTCSVLETRQHHFKSISALEKYLDEKFRESVQLANKKQDELQELQKVLRQNLRQLEQDHKQEMEHLDRMVENMVSG